MDLGDPVRFLPQVGPIASKKLDKLGIVSVGDLLYHLPFRYDDFSLVSKITSVKPNQVVTVKGTIVDLKNQFTKNGKKLQRGTISDQTGQLDVIWFNQLYLPQTLKPGTEVSLSGKVDFFGSRLCLVSPDYEIVKGETLTHTGRLVPVYPETAGISSKWLRTRINSVLKILPPLPDTLPEEIKSSFNLVSLDQALREVHFPTTLESAQKARYRLGFEELLTIHLSALERKNAWKQHQTANPVTIDQEKILNFIGSLPFTLTKSQNISAKDILTDLTKSVPMNRLLEGDVGSGKTVVAAIAAYSVYLSGLKTVFMAPTEILALQHAKTLQTLLGPSGLEIGLLTASHQTTKPSWDILVGTHALLYQEPPSKVGLVIVDEQHRFGVAQRSKLISQKKAPHLLTMTATPIPRTVALTLYGDLDLSVISELPQGRKQIKTYVVPPEKRLDAFSWLEKQITQTKSQAFFIYPLIEESLTETLKSVRAATVEFKKLENIFPLLKLVLLHGRMKAKEKEEAISNFREQKAQILVSTPVVEVGIDIPNAAFMVIEGAERFGLAQLHQLRGRVGRGDKQSYCLLLTETDSIETLSRLKNLTTLSSGAELAELDLKLRGPGEIYGLAQHGFPDLKAASLTNMELISESKKAADLLLEKLDQLPNLRKAVNSYTISEAKPN